MVNELSFKKSEESYIMQIDIVSKSVGMVSVNQHKSSFFLY